MRRLVFLVLVSTSVSLVLPSAATRAGTAGEPVTFVPVSVLEGTGLHAQDVAIADVQGDAGNEILASVASPPSVLVMERQADGSYTQVEAISVEGGVGAIATGDIDLDGDTDLAVSSVDDGVLIYLQGATGLGSAQNVDAGEGQPAALRIADVHAGGWAEIVTGGHLEAPFPHPGLHVIERVAGTWTGTEVQHAVAADVEITDLDGDGRLDIVTASTDLVRVYLQNENEAFASTSVSTDSSVSAIGLGDVNGDGDTDVVADENGGYGVMLGAGDGTLAEDERLSWVTTSSGVAVGDVNGDGLDDVVGRDGVWFVLFLQGAAGLMDPCQWRDLGTGGRPDSDMIGDVTGDGSLDVVAAEGGFIAVAAWERSTTAPTTISASVLNGPTVGFGREVLLGGTMTPWAACPAGGYVGETVEVLVNGSTVKQFAVKDESSFGGRFVPDALGELDLAIRWQGDALHAPVTQDIGTLTIVPGTKYVRVRAPRYVGLGKDIKVVATLLPYQFATDPTMTITATVPGGGPKVLVSGEVDPATGTLQATIPNASRTRVIRATWGGGDGFDPITVKTTTQVGSRTSTVVRGHHARQGAYYVFRRGVPALFLIEVDPNHTGDPVTVELQRFDGVWRRIATDHFRLRQGSRVGILVSPRALHIGERYRIMAEFEGDPLNGGSTSRWSYLKVG